MLSVGSTRPPGSRQWLACSAIRWLLTFLLLAQESDHGEHARTGINVARPGVVVTGAAIILSEPEQLMTQQSRQTITDISLEFGSDSVRKV